MKKKVEVLSLLPAFDPATFQPKPGVVLRYKNEQNGIEQVELWVSQKHILEMIWAENFQDVTGKKVEITMDTIEWKTVITGFVPVDDRTINYTDFLDLKRMVTAIYSALEQGASKPAI
jgi:hypothetical protein